MRIGGTTNKSFKNILKQNVEILSALKSHNLVTNIFVFLFIKLSP